MLFFTHTPSYISWVHSVAVFEILRKVIYASVAYGSSHLSHVHFSFTQKAIGFFHAYCGDEVPVIYALFLFEQLAQIIA